MKQAWRCPRCNTTRVSQIRKHAGVWEAVIRLRDDHSRWSPDCLASVRELRCLRGRKDSVFQKATTTPSLAATAATLKEAIAAGKRAQGYLDEVNALMALRARA